MVIFMVASCAENARGSLHHLNGIEPSEYIVSWPRDIIYGCARAAQIQPILEILQLHGFPGFFTVL
jgi:hypothetical protein